MRFEQNTADQHERPIQPVKPESAITHPDNQPARRSPGELERHGELLAQGLTRDRRWRTECRERMQQRLDATESWSRFGQRLTLVSWSGMLGGLVGMFLGGAALRSALAPYVWWLMLILALMVGLGLIGLAVGYLVMLASRISQSALHRQARHQAIELDKSE